MIGITRYGAHVPYYRLPRSTIAAATGEAALPGQRTVAKWDEDAVTMAAAAAVDALNGANVGTVDAVYLATTTAPYREKQVATTVASALDAHHEVRTADFTDGLRAGSAAMLAAADAVAAGTARQALVAVADNRLGAPGGQLEQLGGDGGAAFLFGREEVVAELESHYSMAVDFIGTWRTPQDSFTRSWEERFVVSEGYQALIQQAISKALARASLTPADFARLVLQAPHPRYHLALAGALGFAGERIQDSLFQTVGLAGTANAPMMLIAALETASPGDRILYVTFGEGCDVLVFRVTDQIGVTRPRRGLLAQLAGGGALSYERYLRWRNLVPQEPARRPERSRPSVPAMWRGHQKNLALYGSRCTACGTPQFPPQRVCIQCRAKDQMEPYRFAQRQGKLVTFTIDHLALSIDSPTLVAVVDFEGGGRAMFEMSDCEPPELSIGVVVGMHFRKLFEAGGIHNYFWKAIPVR